MPLARLLALTTLYIERKGRKQILARAEVCRKR